MTIQQGETMKNLQSELAALDAATIEKRAQLIRQHAVLDQLQPIIDGYHAPMAHFHKLYGSVGSIHLHGCDYAAIREGKQPDRALLVALLAAYPPLDVLRVKDGCTSFRPARHYEENTVREEGLYECYGVTVKIEVFQGPHAEFKWYADLNGETWQFSVKFPLHKTDLGRLDAVAKRYDGHGPVSSWERCEFYAKHDAQKIRWASGGREYPNSFTLYWDRDTGKALDFGQLIVEGASNG